VADDMVGASVVGHHGVEHRGMQVRLERIQTV
jgi:hypothetical protein